MKSKRAVEALAALAQETRLGIFRLLVREGRSGLAAGVIADSLGVSPQRLSFHLKDLAHAGLIQPRHDGRYIYYTADFAAMNDLLAYLTENCCGIDAGECVTDPARCVAVRPASASPISVRLTSCNETGADSRSSWIGLERAPMTPDTVSCDRSKTK